MDDLDIQAVEYFKEYLRIESVHPQCDYDGCVRFLEKRAESLGLPVNVCYVSEGKPVVIISWIGNQPHLPSVLLSSHMDVVPVYPERWLHPPFSAHEDEEGNIFARGTQDTKSIGIQYLEAVNRLILQGHKPKRTVHICFTPDEEIGLLGMKAFIKTETFRSLNVGCAMDEGFANPNEKFVLCHGDRTVYGLEITCKATSDGFALEDKTVGEKVAYVIRKFSEKRAQQKKRLEDHPELTFAGITSINLTMLESASSSEFKVTFDCRVSLDDDHVEFEEWVKNVCELAGKDVSVKYLDTPMRVEATKLTGENPWWVALKDSFDRQGLEVMTILSPGATDSTALRSLGIPAFNFSPMNHTVPTLHDHNESLNKKIFLAGIKIYCDLILALTRV